MYENSHWGNNIWRKRLRPTWKKVWLFTITSQGELSKTTKEKNAKITWDYSKNIKCGVKSRLRRVFFFYVLPFATSGWFVNNSTQCNAQKYFSKQISYGDDEKKRNIAFLTLQTPNEMEMNRKWKGKVISKGSILSFPGQSRPRSIDPRLKGNLRGLGLVQLFLILFPFLAFHLVNQTWACNGESSRQRSRGKSTSGGSRKTTGE